VLAATGLVAYHNQVSGLALVLPAAALLLTRSGPDARLAWLAVALALPSVPLLFAAIDQTPYVIAAWLSTLTLLALGLWPRREPSRA
jgi:hypothetical protein